MGSGKKIYIRNVFNIEEEEILIDLVREHSFLYNPKDKLYKNITARANCWKEIGGILKKNHDECLKKWNSIRDYYIRKRGRPAGTGSSAEFVRKRMAQLVFLEDTSIAKRKTISSVETEDENDMEEEEEDNTKGYATEDTTTQDTTLDGDNEIENQILLNIGLNNTPLSNCNPTPKRRKLKDSVDATLKKNSQERMNLMRTLAAKQALPQDELQLFFASIYQTIKKFPLIMQAQAKLNIANMIGKMEIEFLQSQVEEQETIIFISPTASPDMAPIPATSCVFSDTEVLKDISNNTYNSR